MTRTEFKKIVYAELQKRSMTWADLARELKVSNQHLHAFMSGKFNRVQFGVSVCLALQLPVTLAYQTCGLPVVEYEERGEG